MIIEARCNDCGKHIGYLSVQGYTEMLRDTKYVNKIRTTLASVTLLCDECREGRIDLEGDKP